MTKLNLVLTGIIILLMLYINFCQESDVYTRKQGNALSAKTDSALAKMELIFDKLELLDSSKIINNYFSTKYEILKNKKDSVVAGNPLLVDSLFLYWIHKLRTDTINQTIYFNAW